MIKQECRARWSSGNFLARVPVPQVETSGLQWEPYETYMKAALVSGTPGGLAQLLVEFPAEGSEDNDLHVHPVSDRVITILEGTGTFYAVRHRKLEQFALEPGVKVWMPRGVLHTFLAGPSGMLVESWHNPFVPLADASALVYPSKGGYTWR